MSMTYSKLKKQFIFFKKAQGLAPRTLKDYNTTFRNFERYYKDEVLDIENIKLALFEMFEKFSNGAPATFNVPYSNLMCFFSWSVENEYLEKNPLKLTGLKKKRDNGKARRVSDDVVQKLMEVMDVKTYVGFRDYVFFTLTLDTGLRPSEACGIKLEDLDLEHAEVTIRADLAKTRIKRVLPLSYQTVEILRKFLLIREENWDNYLFLTINGTQMTTYTWELRIKHYREKIKCKCTPYDFRHTFSLLFLKNGR